MGMSSAMTGTGSQLEGLKACPALEFLLPSAAQACVYTDLHLQEVKFTSREGDKPQAEGAAHTPCPSSQPWPGIWTRQPLLCLFLLRIGPPHVKPPSTHRLGQDIGLLGWGQGDSLVSKKAPRPPSASGFPCEKGFNHQDWVWICQWQCSNIHSGLPFIYWEFFE